MMVSGAGWRWLVVLMMVSSHGSEEDGDNHASHGGE